LRQRNRIEASIQAIHLDRSFARIPIVNADFSDEAQVNSILDSWEEQRPDSGVSSHHGKRSAVNDDHEGQSGVTDLKRAPLHQQISIMFRRSVALILRDRKYATVVSLESAKRNRSQPSLLLPA
jgi:hypothetical protein